MADRHPFTGHRHDIVAKLLRTGLGHDRHPSSEDESTQLRCQPPHSWAVGGSWSVWPAPRSHKGSRRDCGGYGRNRLTQRSSGPMSGRLCQSCRMIASRIRPIRVRTVAERDGWVRPYRSLARRWRKWAHPRQMPTSGWSPSRVRSCSSYSSPQHQHRGSGAVDCSDVTVTGPSSSRPVDLVRVYDRSRHRHCRLVGCVSARMYSTEVQQWHRRTSLRIGRHRERAGVNAAERVSGP